MVQHPYQIYLIQKKCFTNSNKTLIYTLLPNHYDYQKKEKNILKYKEKILKNPIYLKHNQYIYILNSLFRYHK